MAVKNTRMCAGCRTRAPKESLIRITKDAKRGATVDLSFKAGGRGVYVCKDLQCLKKIGKNKSLQRNFKTQIPSEIYDDIMQTIQRTVGC